MKMFSPSNKVPCVIEVQWYNPLMNITPNKVGCDGFSKLIETSVNVVFLILLSIRHAFEAEFMDVITRVFAAQFYYIYIYIYR